MFAQGSCESASNDDKRRCLVDISNDDKLSLKGKFGLQRGMVAVGGGSRCAASSCRPDRRASGTKLSFSLQNSQLCHVGRVRAAGGQRAGEIVIRPLGIKLAGVLLNVVVR
jgi:hypothetical protein